MPYWFAAQHVSYTMPLGDKKTVVVLLLNKFCHSYSILHSLPCFSLSLSVALYLLFFSLLNQLSAHRLYEWNNKILDTIFLGFPIHKGNSQRLSKKRKDRQGQHTTLQPNVAAQWLHHSVCECVFPFKWLSLSLSDECFFVLNERQVTLQSDSDPIKPLSFSLCLSSSSLSNRPSHQSEPEAVCYKSSGLGPAVLPLFDPPLQMCVTNKRPWKIKRPFQSMTDHIRS